MRKAFLAGNWKMHKTVSETLALIEELKNAVKSDDHRVMIAPPFTALTEASKALEGSRIELGAQNMAAAESGAHTGEISPDMLLDVGVKVVILGHSERRHTYGETDELVNTKIKLALSKGLDVIFCVGETLEEREAGKVEQVVGSQLENGLAGVDSLDRVVVAYEPVWAIGTGKTATPEDADAVHRFIRAHIMKHYDATVAEDLIIQYGGSVKPGNVASLMAKDNIDGALVGGASLKAETFLPIVQFDA